jgi:hypothetical protein
MEVHQVLIRPKHRVVVMVEETDLALRQVAQVVEVLVLECHLLLPLVEMLEDLPQLKDFRAEVHHQVQVAVVAVVAAQQQLVEQKDKT